MRSNPRPRLWRCRRRGVAEAVPGATPADLRPAGGGAGAACGGPRRGCVSVGGPAEKRRGRVDGTPRDRGAALSPGSQGELPGLLSGLVAGDVELPALRQGRRDPGPGLAGGRRGPVRPRRVPADGVDFPLGSGGVEPPFPQRRGPHVGDLERLERLRLGVGPVHGRGTRGRRRPVPAAWADDVRSHAQPGILRTDALRFARRPRDRLPGAHRPGLSRAHPRSAVVARVAAAGAVRHLADLGRRRRCLGGRSLLRPVLCDDHDHVRHRPETGHGRRSLQETLLEEPRPVAPVLPAALRGVDGVRRPYRALGELVAVECGSGGPDRAGDGDGRSSPLTSRLFAPRRSTCRRRQTGEPRAFCRSCF